jgi:hypothetical protein
VLVYGDRVRIAEPRALLRLVAAGLDVPSGPGAADRLTGALILAGELAQGVADAELETTGADAPTPAQTATMRLAIAVAARLLAAVGEPPALAHDPAAALAGAAAAPLPPRIRCRTPEGYAFYAVYPEAYAAAAAAVAWPAPPLVLGIRSIGTSLAAAVAARIGAEALSVRPGGRPFARELRLSDALAARVRRHRGSVIVADEGPGLSGSSFGSVADALEALGVRPEHIVFLPSHPNPPGPRASPAHRSRWERTVRLVPRPLGPTEVAAWFADLAAPETVEDLSGGAWRRELPQPCRPPAAPGSERLKFRLTGPHGRFLARFAGLGAVGEEKLAVARRLHAAGFVPEPLALRRGFLLERWVEGAPLRAAPPELVAHVGRYLGFRARALPACGAGAAPEELARMATRNADLLGGPALAAAVGRRLAGIARLALAPVRIDGRLHLWEWRRTSDRRLLKTDALDHAVAHDLVGCQDVAWDVAGAAVELDLSDPATEELRRRVADAAGRPVGREAVAAFRLCYSAFQAGLWRMTGEDAPPTERELARYLGHLRRGAGLVGDEAPAQRLLPGVSPAETRLNQRAQPPPTTGVGRCRA